MIIPLNLGLLKVNICLFSLHSLGSHLGPLNISVVMLWTCSRLHVYLSRVEWCYFSISTFYSRQGTFLLSFKYLMIFQHLMILVIVWSMGQCLMGSHNDYQTPSLASSIYLHIYLNLEPILLQTELGLFFSIFTYKCYKFRCPVEKLFCVRLIFVINPFTQQQRTYQQLLF